MIKQVRMPTIIKTNGVEAGWIAAGVKESVERHDRRLVAFEEEIAKAEKELDTALNDGFSIVSNYPIVADYHEVMVFILFKHEYGMLSNE